AEAHVFALRGFVEFPVRHAADHVGARLEGRLHERVGARVAEQAFLRKGDRAHLGDVGAVRGGGHDAFQRDQLADRVDVDVGAEARRAQPDRVFDHRRGARPYVFDRVAALALVDGADRARQRAVMLAQLVADQDLVEVDVAVYEAREDQLARAVEAFGDLRAGAFPDLGDLFAVDHDVGPAAVRQAGILQSPHGRFTLTLARVGRAHM